MKKGKFSPRNFQQIFGGKFGAKNPRIKVASAFGVDTSLVTLADGLSMATASDPLSYISFLGPEKSAALSVHIIANDMATTSVMPQFFQLVLNLNEHFDENDFVDYWTHLHEICCALKISITGGHTGAVAGINATIIGGGTMFSVAESHRFISSCQAKAGHILCMSKKAAVSSVAILGLSFPKAMKKIFGTEKTDYFNNLFEQISVYEEGKLAGELNSKTKKIYAMHDVTEGGVLGAVYEMCMASDLGVALEENAIFYDDIQEKVCAYFNLKPAEIIGTGAMLLAVHPDFLDEVLDTYGQQNMPLRVLGEFQPKTYGIKLNSTSKTENIEYKNRDPYWEAFRKAYESAHAKD